MKITSFKRAYGKKDRCKKDQKWMRKSIMKLRCSNHKLEVEVGRLEGTTSDERFRKLCPGELETELHFLSKYAGYENVRRKIFSKTNN